MILLAVGIGAGLVSALLFAVVITGSPLAILLSYVAPVPILIAALGWKHQAGLLAVLAGSIATAVIFRLEAGLAFAVGTALPGWWLAYLALLGRADPAGNIEWYPLGRLLVWIAVVAAGVTLAGLLALGAGDYASARETLTQALQSLLRLQPGPIPGDGSVTPEAVLDALVSSLPFVAAAGLTLAYTLNLWLAAKTVAISGRLPRPWPDIPSITMPRTIVAVFVAAVLLAFLPGLTGAAGLSLTGALTAAFALQGLALLHDRLRGQPLRVPLLAGAYLLIAFSQGLLLLVPMLFGLLDAAVSIRRSGPGDAGRRLPPP